MNREPTMSGSGYTLDQLLAWCYDDCLIDTYTIRDDTVYVQSGSSTKALDFGNALSYLKSLIREGSGGASQNVWRHPKPLR